MKKAYLLTIAILSVSAHAAEKEKFSCSLTKFIENIDGTMQPRDRQTVAQKDLPASGVVIFEKEVTDGKEDQMKKFRVKGKIFRGERGHWVVEQKLFQVLKEGEREGEDQPYAGQGPGKLTSVEILRTFEQVHKGVPKTEFRLACVVKVPTVDTPVVSVANVDGGSGTKAELPGQEKVANVEIRFAGNFGKGDATLDRGIFTKIVDPEKPAPRVPLVLAPSKFEGAKTTGTATAVTTSAKEAKPSGWKSLWPFKAWLTSKPETTSVAAKNAGSVTADSEETTSPTKRVGQNSIVADTHAPEVAPVVMYPDTGVSLKDLVAKDNGFHDRSKTPKVIPPPQAPYVAPPVVAPVSGVRAAAVPPQFVSPKTVIPASVPLILAPRVLARAVETEKQKLSQNPERMGSRSPASVSQAMTKQVPTTVPAVPIPFQKYWKAAPVAETHPGFFGPPSPPKSK